MRRIAIQCALAALAAAPVAAQDAALSPEARVALDRLQRAGWTGLSATPGCTLTARSAPLFSEGLLEALASAERLEPLHQANLRDVARFELSEPGWLFRVRLDPGVYHLGMEQTPRYRRWVLRDATGAARATDAFWVEGSRTEPASTATRSEHGAVVATLTIGTIEFAWRFVPAPAHAAATALPHTDAAGAVVLHSDLPHAPTREALAKECAAAVPIHAKLLGVPTPKEPLHLHCFTEAARYRAVDALTTGGRFVEQGAFTSGETGQAYVWYVPHASPIAFADHGASHTMRALLLHELHHALTYRFFPGSRGDAWPAWLEEGLAELGTWQALQARRREDGEWFADRVAGAWRYEAQWGAVPAMEDLLAGPPKSMRTAWYAGAFLLARSLERAKPGALTALLPYIEGEPIYRHLTPRLTEKLEQGWKPTPQLYADLVAEAAAGTSPHVMFGNVDRLGVVWRLISSPEGSARLMLPGRLPGADLRVDAEYAWHLIGAHQADLFLAYRGGRDSAQFVKVALLPARIMLFRWRDGFWQTWGDVAYEHELTIGEPTAPTWHPLTVALDAKARTVRVETTGGRWAQFDCKEYVPTTDTQVAIGCSDGAVFWRNVRAK